MSDVEVNLEALNCASDELSYIVSELKGMSTDDRGLSDAVGHAGLRAAIAEFGSAWDRERDAVVDGLQVLAHDLTEAASRFGEADGDIARTLAEALAPPPGGQQGLALVAV